VVRTNRPMVRTNIKDTRDRICSLFIKDRRWPVASAIILLPRVMCLYVRALFKMGVDLRLTDSVAQYGWTRIGK
jgi:hypothetical protein